MSRIPLVFLPGLLCDAELWQQQADALSDIADPFIADFSRDDTISGMARRLLDSAPPRFALAALSMGGYVAFEVFRQAPDRVMRAALFDTSASPDDAVRARQRRAAIHSLSSGRFAGVTHRMLPTLIHESRVHGPVGETVMRMAERVGAEVFLQQQKAIMGRQDSRPGLASIDVPAMVAVGDSDQLTPVDESLAIHQGIAGSEFHVLPACGHLPPLEMPEETAALLRRWLHRPEG